MPAAGSWGQVFSTGAGTAPAPGGDGEGMVRRTPGSLVSSGRASVQLCGSFMAVRLGGPLLSPQGPPWAGGRADSGEVLPTLPSAATLGF